MRKYRNLIQERRGFVSDRSSRGGYTIIETMVSISLFLVIISTGMTALLNARLLQKKSEDVRQAMDNLTFILDDMTRNIRTGSNYHCTGIAGDIIPPEEPKSTPGAGITCEGIIFEPALGSKTTFADQWIYYISGSPNDILYRSTNGGVNYDPLNTHSFLVGSPTFGQGTRISLSTGSGFIILGAEPSPKPGDPPSAVRDHQQPFVIIKLVGTVTSKGVVTPFYIQSAASQRQIDI